MKKMISVVVLLLILLSGCSSIKRSLADRAPAWRIIARYGALRQVELLFRPDLDEKADQPSAIYVAGDFNNWKVPGSAEDGKVLQMDYDASDRYWKLRLLLRKGVYRYVYLIDGRERVADLKSAETRADGSVISRMILY